MSHRINISRQTLLHKHPSLKFGYDSERNVFWIVTSLIAVLLVLMLTIEVIINWNAISQSVYRTSLTFGLLLAAAVWVLIPVALNKVFPLWAGLIGYIIVMVIVAYHFAFSKDPFSVNTALQLLPVSSLYLGWFWRPIPARIIFSITMVVIFASSVISPVFGSADLIPRSVLYFAILAAAFSFSLGSVLRWQLQRKAMTDNLTAVLNRRGLHTVLRIEIDRSRKFQTPFTIAFVDFDYFKKINDTHGHSFGDHVLVSTVNTWLDGTRAYDRIGRVGGDEFIILFPETTIEQAGQVLSRLREKSEFAWTWGLAQLTLDDSVEDLIERADQDLYKHKTHRKNKHPESSFAQKISETKFSAHNHEVKESPLREFLKRQSDLSLMSAALGAVVVISMVLSVIFAEYQGASIVFRVIMILLVLATVFSTVIFLVKGNNFSDRNTYFFSVLILLLYSTLSVFSSHFYGSISLLFAVSLIAIYLGVFLGSITARSLVVSAIMIIGTSILVNFWSYPEEEVKLLAISSILYALITQLFLFEIGSYLYTRSRQHAHHDSLTGVLNRRGLNEYANNEIQRAKRRGYSLSIAVIDCTGFKEINDRFGHQRGDSLLAEMAEKLVSSVDIYDLVARVGGDEFVLVMPYLKPNDAEEKVLALKNRSPLKWDYGIASLDDSEELTLLVKQADEHLYSYREVKRAPKEQAF